MSAMQLTKCRCGQPMTSKKNVLVCPHCDQPCAVKNCTECKRAGVGR